MDRFYYGSCDRISPEAPVPVLKFSRVEEMPGMAANVTENVKAFTDHVDLICQEERITKSRFIDEKTKQHILRFDEDARIAKSFDATNIDLSKYDIIILSDYDKGFLTADKISNFTGTEGQRFYVDTKKTNLSFFKNAILKINEKERTLIDETSIPETSEILTTLGAGGAAWDGIKYATSAVDIFDVSGAGDTFLVAFSVFHHLTSDPAASIKFANKCSRIVVQMPGTQPLDAKFFITDHLEEN
mgnify:CR=1 FL=1